MSALPTRRAADLRGLHGHQLLVDRVEDIVHFTAGERQRRDADQRDQRHEQRVFDQVLALVIAQKPVHVIQQIHVALSPARPTRMPCAMWWLSRRRADRCPPSLRVALPISAGCTATSFWWIALKILFTSPPASVSAPTQTSEISATSSAYSIRSWPSSSRRNPFT